MSPQPSSSRTAWQAILHFVLPPAASGHQRYRGRKLMLVVDTLLVVLMYAVIVGSVYLVRHLPLYTAGSVTVDLTVPAQVTSADQTTVNFIVTNTGNAHLQHLSAVIDLPSQAIIDGNGTVTQSIGTIVAGNRWVGHLDLRPLGTPSETMHIRVRIIDTQSHQTRATAVATTTIGQSALRVTLDGPTTTPSASPYTMTVTLHNDGSLMIPGAWFTAVWPANFVPTTPETTSQQVNVGDLEPHATHVVSLTGISQTASDVVLPMHVEAGLVIGGRTLIQSSASTTVTITPPTTSSNPTPIMTAVVRYAGPAGVQYGFGPLPPVAGQTTGYRVFWTVKSTTMSLRSMRIQAALSSNVSWSGHPSVTAGSAISYSPGTRTITWDIGDLAASGQMFTGSFDVTITPTAANVGKTMRLVEEAQLNAQTEAGVPVLLSVPTLSTVLTDTTHPDSGIVQHQ